MNTASLPRPESICSLRYQDQEERRGALIGNVANPVGVDGKLRFAFWKVRRVNNFKDSGFTAALSQRHSGGDCVGNDVAADWFGGRSEHSTVDAGSHLVGDDDSAAKLVCSPGEQPQVFRQQHLAGRELATAGEVCSEQSCQRVHNDQRVPGFAHHGAALLEQLVLVLRVVSACVRYVVQAVFRADAVAFGDGDQALWPEGAFRVDPQRLPFAAATVDWQLCGLLDSRDRMGFQSSIAVHQSIKAINEVAVCMCSREWRSHKSAVWTSSAPHLKIRTDATTRAQCFLYICVLEHTILGYTSDIYVHIARSTHAT